MSEGLVRHLVRYAAAHRDRRNVATHMVGIPMIVLGIEVLLSRPQVRVADIVLAPVDLAIVAICCFYFTLDRRLACGMAVALAVGGVIAGKIAEQGTSIWLAAGFGLFGLGWVCQLLGHVWEGRRPAFLEDARGLLIGPLFVLVEATFSFGKRLELKRAIEARLAAPVDLRASAPR